MSKTRLDLLLMERGLTESRSKAQAIIMAGQVRVNGQVVDRSSAAFLPDVDLTVEAGPRFVSRGGEKLLAALETFPINPAGRVCADVGASTGGFSDCLLQYAAAKIYAIDVGKGILHWKIRSDARVVVMEETNARYVEALPEAVTLVVCDASFISLRILLPVMKRWLAVNGEVITLIKPQFEAGRKESARGAGVIRDPAVHQRVLAEVLDFARQTGFSLRGLIKSPVVGPKGNIEFLAWLDVQPHASMDIPRLVEKALAG
ncbi:MAG: TlyA family rRNA (cytidine-2'-O)-methyltransferase [Anaerolineae bacterium CG_4_9_14_3_um_filter_57_17]|nr:TlyA family RNA methyltransferase [bacterium]NCT19942.1 TlyA family RNA methyltransferase [bacterium]OIO86016.1 MAG: TlyA family rRNA (cytidine-2'-O)-methyltransferase [Anaerolineae bacterium CG2_30_57_67]PJB65920.1 MAG: TlyA family rRNA (cytidine-2'-O)-methyltransferase [Anaerolineae bacterium CG_4_9_14_3_um_filter_57_17]